MTDLALFREYEPWECGDDGYPYVWHAGVDGDGSYGVKHLVRAEAENRCIRCGHPFVVGESGVMEEGDDLHPERTERDTGFTQEAWDMVLTEAVANGLQVGNPDGGRRTNWSPCDEHCTHAGPLRWRRSTMDETGWNLPPNPTWKVLDDPDRDPADVLSGDSAGGGVRQGVEVQAAWRILTVHHLNERKHDLRWFNLVALCQRDHLLIQRKVKMERPYPWPHSEWFHPYVAAHYAVKYGANPSPTREWTILNLGGLLALGREQESVERMAL